MLLGNLNFYDFTARLCNLYDLRSKVCREHKLVVVSRNISVYESNTRISIKFFFVYLCRRNLIQHVTFDQKIYMDIIPKTDLCPSARFGFHHTVLVKKNTHTVYNTSKHEELLRLHVQTSQFSTELYST